MKMALQGELDKALHSRAMALLARREYSQAELRTRLLRVAAQWLRQQRCETEEACPVAEETGEEAEIVDQVLSVLTQSGYLSDQRFSEQMVRHHASKSGVQRISYVLRQKGVSADKVQAALAGLQASELSRAHLVWQKKFGVLPIDAASRGKQARFLQSRGFAFEVIAKVLAGVACDDDSEAWHES